MGEGEKMSVILPLNVAVVFIIAYFLSFLGHVYVYFSFLIAVVGHMPFFNKNFLLHLILYKKSFTCCSVAFSVIIFDGCMVPHLMKVSLFIVLMLLDI